VHVAVGVITNDGNDILIAKRAADVHQGGLWEFPGGKVDAGETVQEALGRELQEELSIRVEACQPLLEIRHDYGDKVVRLDVWHVSQFSGTVVGNEGQPVLWVAANALESYEFPKANSEIIERVQALFMAQESVL